MKGQLKVATPKEYLAKLKEPRKSDVRALDELIRKTAPELEPFIQIGMRIWKLIVFRVIPGTPFIVG